MVVDQSENNCCNNNFIYEAISRRGVRNVLWKHIKTKPPGKRAGGELRLRKSKTCGHLWKGKPGQQSQLAEYDHNESLLGILNKCEILSEGEVEKEFCKVYTLWHKTTCESFQKPNTRHTDPFKKEWVSQFQVVRKWKRSWSFSQACFLFFPISYISFYCWQQ